MGGLLSCQLHVCVFLSLVGLFGFSYGVDSFYCGCSGWALVLYCWLSDCGVRWLSGFVLGVGKEIGHGGLNFQAANDGSLFGGRLQLKQADILLRLVVGQIRIIDTLVPLPYSFGLRGTPVAHHRALVR